MADSLDEGYLRHQTPSCFPPGLGSLQSWASQSGVDIRKFTRRRAKHNFLDPQHSISHSLGLVWDLRICISNKSLLNADIVGPEAPLGNITNQLLKVTHFECLAELLEI